MYMPKLVILFIGINLCLTAASPVRTSKTSYNGVYHRCVQNGTIALTFDDGPHEDKTPGILDILQSLNVSATFFVVGWRLHLQAAKDTLRRTYKEGYYVGSHTWNHPDLTGLDNNTIESEMTVLSDSVYEILNHRPKAMRPPFGAINDLVVNVVNGQLGYRMIMWSIDTGDWAHPGDTKAGLRGYANALEGTNPRLTPGFIALHHDPLDGSADLALASIRYVRRLGYRHVSLAECLGIPL